MFPISDKTAALQYEQFYCFKLIFPACLSKQQVQPIPVYAIVYRHSIIHPSGVFDRLYPNEHSPIHPPRATHV